MIFIVYVLVCCALGSLCWSAYRISASKCRGCCLFHHVIHGDYYLRVASNQVWHLLNLEISLVELKAEMKIYDIDLT